MKYPMTLALGLLALALPATAMADNHLTDADVRLGEDAWELRLESEQNLGEPRIRTTPGYARVWFPHMGTSHMDREGDGRAVRFVRVRAGYEDTAVAIIRLGDMRRLPDGAVSVTRDGTVARIRIDRSLLPAPAPTPALAPPEDVAEDLAEADAAPTDEAAAAEETDAEALAAATPEPAASEPALALTRSSQAAPLPSGDGPSTMLVLLGLTLLLGGLYLGIRAFGRHRVQKRAHIEVVAQKRIGARQQLMVVRALGEDHLIAVQGGRTERLASMPAPEADDVLSGGGGLGGDDNDLLPFLKLGRKPTPDTKVPTVHRQKTTERPARVRDDRPRFGAELMRMVAERGTADRVTLGANTLGMGSAAPAGGPSEAVAGLLRLREKLGR